MKGSHFTKRGRSYTRFRFRPDIMLPGRYGITMRVDGFDIITGDHVTLFSSGHYTVLDLEGEHAGRYEIKGFCPLKVRLV